MREPLKSPAARPDAAPPPKLAATTNSAMPPAVMSRTGSETINLRVSSSLIDELDAAANAAGTTRKVIVTRALAAAGYHVPPHDLEDRTPRRRRAAT